MNPITRFARALVLNCLAALTFLLLALTGRAGAGLVAAAVTLALVAWWARSGGLGKFVTVRLLVVCGLLVLWMGEAETGSAAILTSGAILVVVVGSERDLLPATRVARVKTANLPAYSRGRRLPPSRQTVFSVNLGAVAVLGLLTGFDGPAWVMLVVAICAAAVSAYLIVEAVVTRERLDTATGDLVSSLESHAPEFMVHFSGPADSAYQLMMWLPYFDRIGRPYIVVLREAALFEQMASATTSPVLVCRSIAALESAVVPSLRVSFYVNNGMKNTHAVRFSQLTHIQLLHGDSDKPPSFNPVTAMFDRIFVAGEAGVDRYAANGVEIPRSKFSIVGRPQVELIQGAATPIAEVSAPVVLYAPTWKGNYSDADYCSLPIGADLLKALVDRGATVILRSHPYSSRDSESSAQLAVMEKILADDRAASGRAHLWGPAASVELTLFDCFNASDALVADVSSVVSDYLFSEKPLAIVEMLSKVGEGALSPVHPDPNEQSFVERFPVARAAYILREDGNNWAELLDDLLQTDTMRDVRLSVRTYYLGPFATDGYADAFLAEARRCL